MTLREEHGVGVFENRVLRRMLGLKKDEVVVNCITSSFARCNRNGSQGE
jgi:hypothetical protein